MDPVGTLPGRDRTTLPRLEAIAGRAHPDASQRLAVFAVGDDDQCIFDWRGSSARWVGEFAATWCAQQLTRTACYRCTTPILDAAATVITPVADRLKAGVLLHPRGAGDPVRRWMAGRDQIGSTVVEVLGDAREVAILARTRAALAPVRAALEAAGVPVAWPLAHDERLPLARIREVVRVLDALDARSGEVLDAAALAGLVDVGPGPWRPLLERWRDDVLLTHGDPGALGATLRRALWEQLGTERGERSWVVAGVRAAIDGAAEVLVAPGPIRPLLALSALLPGVQGPVLRMMGVTDALRACAKVVRRHG